MDPYLEQEWGHVHAALVIKSSEALQSQLGDALVVRAERRIVVEDSLLETRREFVPDVVVTGLRQPRDVDPGVAIAEPEPATDTIATPVILQREQVEVPQTFLRILDPANGNQVVTVIEFVSPSNKRVGDGRDKYQQKRTECIDAGVNFVEIDLTRHGDRLSLLSGEFGTSRIATEYESAVYRASKDEQIEYYPFSLWEPLPGIRVPLRKNDADTVLFLQPLIDEIYTRSRFRFDYTKPCAPPLSDDDAATLHRRLTNTTEQATKP